MNDQQTKTGAGAGELERRKTPTERYHELALQAAARQPAATEHTLDLTRNSKGDVQIALTVRAADLDELEQQATELFDRLCRKYERGGSDALSDGYGAAA